MLKADSQRTLSRKRSVRFEHPLAILFAVKSNVFHLNLRQGDIVLVVDYSRKSSTVVVQKDGKTIDVPKAILKRADPTDLKKYYEGVAARTDASSYGPSLRMHKTKSKVPMPLRYEAIGYKVVEFNGSFITLFFFLVSPYSRDKGISSNAGVCDEFYYTRDQSWIVVKTQRCIEKLHIRLEKYVGKNNLPPANFVSKNDESSDEPCQRKPADWETEKWLNHRTQMLADFFIEFKNPKRGYYLGNRESQVASKPMEGYTHNPLLGSVLGVISRNRDSNDEFSKAKSEENALVEDILRNRNKNKYLKGKAATYISNDAPELAALDWKKDTKTEHLILGLPPLAQFFLSDKVTLLVRKPDMKKKNEMMGKKCEDMVPHSEVTDNELIEAVQNGEFEISPLTPIDSMLKIWVVAGADRREDHVASDAVDNSWQEPEMDVLSEWQVENDIQGDTDNSDESYENSVCSMDDFNYDDVVEFREKTSAVDVTKGYIRYKMFATRAARAAIMSIESEALRRRLLRGFMDTPPYTIDVNSDLESVFVTDSTYTSVQSSISTMKKSLASIENYLTERQDACDGLETFSHFGLMILSTACKHSDDNKQSPDSDDCSVGSLTAVVHGLTASEHNDSDDNNENALTKLNAKVHSLLLEWERRREITKERNIVDKTQPKDSNKSVEIKSSVKSSPKISSFIVHLKNCCYKKSTSQQIRRNSDVSTPNPYLRYPSQMRNMAPLTEVRVSDYITSRTKTRLSRKSERVLIIERMKGTELAFQTKRMTMDQMRILLESIEGTDEKQHAALLFITRLTDVLELENNFEIYKRLDLSDECEQQVKIVGSVLSAEARAEDDLLHIHNIYTDCFAEGQKIKSITNAKKGEDADYLRFKSIKMLKDAPVLSPKLQNEIRNEIKARKSDVSTMREALSRVHAFLKSGYSEFLSNIQKEKELIIELSRELKLIVTRNESLCRIRGMLTAGRPEYLVFHRLKAALASVDKAKTIVGEVLDEATSLLASIRKILNMIDDSLASTIKSSSELMNKVRDSTQSSGKNSKLNPSVVEKEMDDFLSDNQLSAHSTYAAGTQSSVAMITGLTAACAGAGWRRYLQEVSSENNAKFQNLIVPRGDFDESNSKQSFGDTAHTDDVTIMCLLLSRLPILKDMLLAQKASSQKEGADDHAQGDTIKDEDSLVYDDPGDDFSYAGGVYEETF